MTNSRQIAMLILYSIEYDGAYSNMELKNQLSKHNDLSSIDKNFITNLVYGVVKQKATLDYVIEKYSKVKLKKISKYILQILRLGIYQIMFMDKVPESASVNESVKLAKRYGHTASSGYVNGLLHSVIRGQSTFSYPTEKIKFLSVKYSFPTWLVEKWISDFGEDFAQDLMKASNKQPKMTLRTNTIKITTNTLLENLQNCGINAEKSDIYENAIYTSGFDVASSNLYNDGLFTIQDLSAMMASIVLEPHKGENVIDMCSAPGGKTTHLAQIMQNTGNITAFDVHEHKISIIEKNAKRLGINIIKAQCKNSLEFDDKYRETADKILVDVPCSGLGIIRKKPDIKWNKQETDELNKVQYEILTTASKYLKHGGELVYSTCTIDKNENEFIIDKFLNENNDFERVDITNLLPQKLQKPTAKNGYVTFYPNVDDIDGFFICKMKKR